MKRFLIVVLLVIVAAGALGTLAHRDPGYILITYQDHVLQTSLWAGLIILSATLFVGYYGVKLIRGFLLTGKVFSNWRSNQAQRRAANLTRKGMLLLYAGDYERAARFLKSAADDTESPVVNYLGLAEAFHYVGDEEAREKYLRLAVEADPDASQSAALLSAKLRAERDEWPEVLDSLEKARNSRVALDLKKRAYQALEDWDSLEAMLPALHRVEDTSALKHDIAMARIHLPDATNKKAELRKLTVDERKDTDVVLAYVDGMAEKQAEGVLRKSLQDNWDRNLLIAYAELGAATLDKRLKQVRTWEKQRSDDAALQLALGILLEEQGERQQAKAYYEKSHANRPSREASERLAHLLAFEGNYQDSTQYLKAALAYDKNETSR